MSWAFPTKDECHKSSLMFSQHCFRTWCRQATSLHLRQRWIRPMSQYCVARLEWIETMTNDMMKYDKCIIESQRLQPKSINMQLCIWIVLYKMGSSRWLYIIKDTEILSRYSMNNYVHWHTYIWEKWALWILFSNLVGFLFKETVLTKPNYSTCQKLT